jgi:pimeloyl-ACP methyl ester carboxylesterase
MRLLLIGAALLVVLVLAAGALFTWVMTSRIERRTPPLGQFMSVNGKRLHFVDHGPRDATVVVLIHGASGNLRDQLAPVMASLGQDFRLIALDRPGHGWSERGPDDATPIGQARSIGALLDQLGISGAIMVGHSFGGAVAASVALERPDLARGLLLLSPATHPWPGGKTSWYNHLARVPVLGWLFTRTLALPGGLVQLKAATDCVYAPNRQPDTYLADAGIALVLTPRRFMDNAVDVTGLFAHATATAPRYKDIAAPTLIIAGDHDTVASPAIHSAGLARDIFGARLLIVRNLGHKPDYAAADLVAAAIRHLSGETQDLDGMQAAVEARLQADAFGPVERCPPPFKPVEAGS